MTQYPVSGIHAQSSGLLQRAWITAPAPPSAAHTPRLLSSCWLHSTAAAACDGQLSHGIGISKVWGLLLQLGCVFTNSISGTLFRMLSLSFFMASAVLGLPLLHWLHLHWCLFWSPPVPGLCCFPWPVHAFKTKPQLPGRLLHSKERCYRGSGLLLSPFISPISSLFISPLSTMGWVGKKVLLIHQWFGLGFLRLQNS